ncbi:hypothetical protein OG225_07470 [Nocardia sp. NBC_01377]|uniref:hypothetical protein n=1 Tax=Nocardia sp. NBC_01377 TaxID=2903595 RepID=UPI00325653F9
MSTDNPEQTVVYDDDVMITMRGVADSVGLPYTINPFELIDQEALAELREGPAGPTGAEGAPAWPWSWQGDIADEAALFALPLTTADARKAWRLVASDVVYFWTGLEFIGFEDAFGTPGRRGAPNPLSGKVQAGAAGSSAAASVTGTAPGQVVEVTIPRGVTGDVGDPGAAGRIQDAADVQIDATYPLGQNFVLAWDAATAKFRPVPNPRPRGPWVLGENQFTGGKNLLDASKVVATVTIPAQPNSWRPLVEGALGLQSEQPTRCDIEVRIGGPDGDLVGYGWGHLVSRFGHVLISGSHQYPMQPGSTIGVVPANQTITLYVVVKRVAGAGSYNIYTNYSQLTVRAQPM